MTGESGGKCDWRGYPGSDLQRAYGGATIPGTRPGTGRWGKREKDAVGEGHRTLLFLSELEVSAETFF